MLLVVAAYFGQINDDDDDDCICYTKREQIVRYIFNTCITSVCHSHAPTRQTIIRRKTGATSHVSRDIICSHWSTKTRLYAALRDAFVRRSAFRPGGFVLPALGKPYLTRKYNGPFDQHDKRDLCGLFPGSTAMFLSWPLTVWFLQFIHLRRLNGMNFRCLSLCLSVCVCVRPSVPSRLGSQGKCRKLL